MKRPLSSRDLPRVLAVLRRETKAFKYPVVGKYSADPFHTLISTLLSLRTQDRTTEEASGRLFALARDPRAMLAVPLPVLRRAIYPVSFYRVKAERIHQICRILLERHGGKVPSSLEELLELPGVGRKTANLVVTLGFDKPGICVDIHVHRITNRWGYVRTQAPDETEQALRAKLPRRYWIELNDLLVAWGQNVCRPLSPWCGRCPIERWCPRVGVTSSR